MRIGFHIPMVKCASIMHIHFMVIFQVSYKHRNVTSDETLRSSIGTIIRPELAKLLMLKFSIVRKYSRTSKVLMSTGKLKGFGNFLKS